jgi:hypothetical protein
MIRTLTEVLECARTLRIIGTLRVDLGSQPNGQVGAIFGGRAVAGAALRTWRIRARRRALPSTMLDWARCDAV